MASLVLACLTAGHTEPVRSVDVQALFDFPTNPPFFQTLKWAGLRCRAPTPMMTDLINLPYCSNLLRLVPPKLTKSLLNTDYAARPQCGVAQIDCP